MSTNRLHTLHERRFESNRFVYPVISRRSAGLSIGVNLNPDKVCNFDCIYCQVDRTTESDTRFVETDDLLAELDQMLALAAGGQIYQTEKFSATPTELRRLNDIAFSGDGEPTTHTNFDEVVTACAELKAQHGLDATRMVLITNASMFHRPHVQRGLQILDANNGQIWAKLEAGTEDYFHLVDRTKIPFQRVLDNILSAAQQRPIVIQALFMRVRGEPPTPAELDAFCGRLRHISHHGGELDHVQIYTVARQPAESFVAPLANGAIDAIVSQVKQTTGLSAKGYYGAANPMIEPKPKPTDEDPSLWRPVWIIMAAVGGWGLYHAVGALRSDENWQIGLIKALIIFGCVAGFLGFWAVALKVRARNDRMR